MPTHRLSIMKCLLPVGIIGLGLCAGVHADNAEEPEARIRAMKKEAAALKEAGRADESMAVVREIEALSAKVKAGRKSEEERRGDEKSAKEEAEIAGLKDRLQDLRAALKAQALREDAPKEEQAALREKIGELERQLAFQSNRIQAVRGKPEHQKEMPPEFRERAEKLEHASRRLRHLHMAAENLKAAEFHDMAHMVMERFEVSQAELEEEKRRLSAEMTKFREHMAREQASRASNSAREEAERARERKEQVSRIQAEQGNRQARDLREENERLKRELQELRQALESRGNKE